MNSNDLLDIVGEAEETHVLDAVKTRTWVQPEKKRLSLNRVVLIAAVIALALLLVGCTVAYILSLQDLKIAEDNIVSNYDNNGKSAAPTVVTMDVISLQGYAGSANQKATLEWYEYEKTCTAIVDDNINGIPDNYYYVYDCQNWDMVEKVDEIAKKYCLKLLSVDTVVQRWQTGVFFDALGIDGMLKPNSPATETIGCGYFYPEGNFKYEFEMKLSGGEDVWPYEIWATMFCSKKDYFDPDVLLIDIDAFDQWNYTTKDGTPVLIAVQDYNGLLFAETGDNYITLNLNTTAMLSKNNNRRATKADFERIADVINFDIQPKTENMVAAIPAMETADKEHWAEDKAEPVGYSQYPSYSDYLLNTTSYTSIKGWCAVMDINGDGVEELLQGDTPDSFSRAATMIDGEAWDYLIMDKAYPCEDSVIEVVTSDVGGDYYAFQKISPGVLYVSDPDTTPELLEYVMHDTQSDCWYTGTKLESRTQISKEEAEFIRAKYPRIEMNMTPIAEYLMDKDGTTFREVERQNTDKLTEAEQLSIYAEIIENDQNKSYVPCNYYCLMDINGDGIEDLLLGETAEYFGNAFTIFNGKGATIRIWSHMNMCKNGILEISGSTPKGEHHHYYRFDANELIHLESVHYNYYPEEWFHELPGSTEFQSITEAEFQTIIASYPRIHLDMKPIADFPS